MVYNLTCNHSIRVCGTEFMMHAGSPYGLHMHIAIYSLVLSQWHRKLFRAGGAIMIIRTHLYGE